MAMCAPERSDGRLNTHCAAPVVAYRAPGSYDIYAIISNREGRYILSVPDVAALRSGEHQGGESVTLATFTHPASDKAVVITWRAADKVVEVSTFYADMPPHAINKAYIFTIDEGDGVQYLAW